MDAQILIVLFLLFSVVSTVFKKWQDHRNPEPDESKLRRKHPSTQVGRNDPFEEDVDLSEWEILLGAPKKEKKPEPKPVIQEFREVKGKRTVDESDKGPEFREVKGKRTVQETHIGPEFKAVKGKRTVDESRAYDENDITSRPARLEYAIRPKRKPKKKQRLSFSRKSVRQAIVYNEIIGKPRAENMPF
jgi:hypothetical protein